MIGRNSLRKVCLVFSYSLLHIGVHLAASYVVNLSFVLDAEMDNNSLLYMLFTAVACCSSANLLLSDVGVDGTCSVL